MLIIALVLALIGLVVLVFAVATSNLLMAWVCIGASVLGVLLLIVDAVREHQCIDAANNEDKEDTDQDDGAVYVDYLDEVPAGTSTEAPDAGSQEGDTNSGELSGYWGRLTIDTGEQSAVAADDHDNDRAT
ncbi:hypothetical protein JK2ML_0923 [Mycobacterium leprae Kyoto-2]|uniref:Possible membrane protein n=3 Tax=Mycobacterium leprae TaxID=1769 RepID=Q9CCD9_MYCLE|nr:hypothetical protein [Mycobacterium leprae]CAR71018.1 possible membrane protein [Mycobacterium leprae Br4923]AWV49001.1 hypothetical protein DIJ64_04980 [Mycobacterium leprae]OAR21523.1 hypothetical protein A8144_05210 [Mycobacterium leprae 3125609]OAX71685.1 hypothetical protein A3216_03930 [Mycobacterium leprae 7935681]CAC31304.1 possible membrane protein [Mycobacterium leprae]